jgi:hypothetical protein
MDAESQSTGKKTHVAARRLSPRHGCKCRMQDAAPSDGYPRLSPPPSLLRSVPTSSSPSHFPYCLVYNPQPKCCPRFDARFARLDALSSPTAVSPSRTPSARAAIIVFVAVYSPKPYSPYHSPIEVFQPFTVHFVNCNVWLDSRLDLELPLRLEPLNTRFGFPPERLLASSIPLALPARDTSFRL